MVTPEISKFSFVFSQHIADGVNHIASLKAVGGSVELALCFFNKSVFWKFVAN